MYGMGIETNRYGVGTKPRRGVDITSVSAVIYNVRGEQVMLDSDLAALYHTTTQNFNAIIERNLCRFPAPFRFRLTKEEFAQLRQEQRRRAPTISPHSDYARNKRAQLRHAPASPQSLPYVFTEEGVAMLSGVLCSVHAARVSIHIAHSFIEMRHLAALHEQKIFFSGQSFDARSFLVGLIKQAKQEIILVDSYVDVNTLDLLANKAKNVSVKILTLPSSSLPTGEVTRFNKKYPTLGIVRTAAFHDRFLISDKTHCYHIGASLKDAGEKCFAVTRLKNSLELSQLITSINKEIAKKLLQNSSRS